MADVTHLCNNWYARPNKVQCKKYIFCREVSYALRQAINSFGSKVLKHPELFPEASTVLGMTECLIEKFSDAQRNVTFFLLEICLLQSNNAFCYSRKRFSNSLEQRHFKYVLATAASVGS